MDVKGFQGKFCVLQYSLAERTVPVPVSVPGKRFRRFRFRVRFLGKRFRRFRFPVPVRFLGHPGMLSTSDCQSEVGEVFGDLGGELPAKFGRRFSSFFCWGKLSEAFSTKTPPQISPSNFTTRFWAVAGPRIFKICSYNFQLWDNYFLYAVALALFFLGFLLNLHLQPSKI